MPQGTEEPRQGLLALRSVRAQPHRHRPASRPSSEGAADYLDRAAALCRQAGFRRVSFRGDTDFTQTAHLDRWDRQGLGFVFGIDAQPNLVALAQRLAQQAWQPRPRLARYPVATEPRQRPANVKQEVVRRQGYTDIRLVGEEVAEFNYRPGRCLRKHLVLEKHGQPVGEETRYFFYLTNEWTWERAEVGYFANDRGNQENLIEQLKNGVRALRAPVNTLEANGAYLVIASLAWTVKAWLALLQPRAGLRQLLLTMEFKRFRGLAGGGGHVPDPGGVVVTARGQLLAVGGVGQGVDHARVPLEHELDAAGGQGNEVDHPPPAAPVLSSGRGVPQQEAEQDNRTPEREGATNVLPRTSRHRPAA